MKTSGRNPFYGSMSVVIGAIALSLFVFIASAMAADSQALTRRTFVDLIKKSKPASLNLKCFGRTFGNVGMGSGFLVKDDQGELWVITNKHVIEGAVVIKAETDNGNDQEIILKVVRVSHQADLAILEIVSCPDKSRLKALGLADSDRTEEGEWVLAIGNPFGQSGTSSVGIVSKIGRKLDLPNISFPHRFFQMNMSVNPGNSGGPLINLDGLVTGVIVIKGGEGMAFAIPSNIVKEEIALIGAGADAGPGWLGMVVGAADADTLECFGHAAGLTGLLVMSVAPDGPAGRAGLKQGDLITRVDGEKAVADTARPGLEKEKFERKILNSAPGSGIALTIVSPGEPSRDITLTVAER